MSLKRRNGCWKIRRKIGRQAAFPFKLEINKARSSFVGFSFSLSDQTCRKLRREDLFTLLFNRNYPYRLTNYSTWSADVCDGYFVQLSLHKIYWIPDLLKPKVLKSGRNSLQYCIFNSNLLYGPVYRLFHQNLNVFMNLVTVMENLLFCLSLISLCCFGVGKEGVVN